jgi:hypothetical protein
MSSQAATPIQPAKTSLHAPDPRDAVLRELKGKREPLQRRFEDNPTEVHLALELKVIDDQIADFNRQIQSEKRKQK